MDDVARIRDRIDELDQEIVRLLKNRHENAKVLGRIKSQRGLDYRDPEREKIILSKIERSATSLDLDPKLIRPIFEQIFALSVQAQRDHPERSAKRLDQARILIVGGTGGMGRFFARFAILQGAKVKLAGREINKTRTAAKEMEIEPGTILDAASLLTSPRSRPESRIGLRKRSRRASSTSVYILSLDPAQITFTVKQSSPSPTDLARSGLSWPAHSKAADRKS